eukprot:927511-Pleurochrysis_carterae.AAC.1
MWALCGVALRNNLLAARENARQHAASQLHNAQQDQAVAPTSSPATARLGNNDRSSSASARPVFRFNITWRPTFPSSTSGSSAPDTPAAASAQFDHEHGDADTTLHADGCSDVSDADSNA